MSYCSVIEEYLEPGTYDVHDFSTQQVTLPLHGEYTLRREVQAKLDAARKVYERGEAKRHLKRWQIVSRPSGMHEFVDKDGKRCLALHSFDNYKLMTACDDPDPITTSILVYVDPQFRFVWTRSGTVYSLDPTGDVNARPGIP